MFSISVDILDLFDQGACFFFVMPRDFDLANNLLLGWISLICKIPFLHNAIIHDVHIFKNKDMRGRRGLYPTILYDGRMTYNQLGVIYTPCLSHQNLAAYGCLGCMCV